MLPELDAAAVHNRIGGSPILRGTLEYWEGLNRACRRPRLPVIDHLSAAEYFENSCCVKIVANCSDFRFWRIGGRFLKYLNRDYTDQNLSEISEKRPGSNIWHAYSKTCIQKRPQYGVFRYTGPTAWVKSTEEIYLPFGDGTGAGTVTDIAVFVQFREDDYLSVVRQVTGLAVDDAPVVGPI